MLRSFAGKVIFKGQGHSRSKLFEFNDKFPGQVYSRSRSSVIKIQGQVVVGGKSNGQKVQNKRKYYYVHGRELRIVAKHSAKRRIRCHVVRNRITTKKKISKVPPVSPQRYPKIHKNRFLRIQNFLRRCFCENI